MFNFAFNSFNEAIYMNGHGIYVWSVLIIVILSLLIFFKAYSSKIKKIKKKIGIDVSPETETPKKQTSTPEVKIQEEEKKIDLKEPKAENKKKK